MVRLWHLARQNLKGEGALQAFQQLGFPRAFFRLHLEMWVDPQPVADDIARLTKERGTRESQGAAQSPTLDAQGFEEKRKQAMRKAGILVVA